MCYRYLKDRQAPIDPLITRGIVYAGLIRPSTEREQIPKVRLDYILNLVRAVEGDEVGDKVATLAYYIHRDSVIRGLKDPKTRFKAHNHLRQLIAQAAQDYHKRRQFRSRPYSRYRPMLKGTGEDGRPEFGNTEHDKRLVPILPEEDTLPSGEEMAMQSGATPEQVREYESLAPWTNDEVAHAEPIQAAHRSPRPGVAGYAPPQSYYYYKQPTQALSAPTPTATAKTSCYSPSDTTPSRPTDQHLVDGLTKEHMSAPDSVSQEVERSQSLPAAGEVTELSPTRDLPAETRKDVQPELSESYDEWAHGPEENSGPDLEFGPDIAANREQWENAFKSIDKALAGYGSTDHDKRLSPVALEEEILFEDEILLEEEILPNNEEVAMPSGAISEQVRPNEVAHAERMQSSGTSAQPDHAAAAPAQSYYYKPSAQKETKPALASIAKTTDYSSPDMDAATPAIPYSADNRESLHVPEPDSASQNADDIPDQLPSPPASREAVEGTLEKKSSKSKRRLDCRNRNVPEPDSASQKAHDIPDQLQSPPASREVVEGTLEKPLSKAKRRLDRRNRMRELSDFVNKKRTPQTFDKVIVPEISELYDE
jgi:hypothetical protein